ncbi:MAG: hypothetical protein KDD11_06675 [Acidobacteria bacterium]|nr:hypothetical protein [Acidobacteriota bacterium]
MPSQAYSDYCRNRIDVERLIESHGELHGGGPGKKGLGHITRSGVVMLCAAWELYTESLVVEAVRYLVAKCTLPNQLPLPVQKEIARHVRESRHELKPLMLSGDGWKQVLISHAEQSCARINTPKSAPLKSLYTSLTGFDLLPGSWPCGAAQLDTFVGIRGDIAHRGRAADYVKIGELRSYLEMIDAAAKASDNAVSDHLVAVTPGGKKPWRITT